MTRHTRLKGGHRDWITSGVVRLHWLVAWGSKKKLSWKMPVAAMRTPRTRTTPIAATHHMKSYRRQHGIPAHLDMSIRFTSLFIIAVAICEFSGLSQALADAYTAVTLRFSTSNSNSHLAYITPYPHYPHDRSQSYNTNSHHENGRGGGRNLVVRPLSPIGGHPSPAPLNRAALAMLYRGVHPDTTVARMQEKRRLPTPPRATRPTFAIETFWSDQDFDRKVCRVHNVCIRNDGTLLIHPELKRHEAALRECSVQKLGYLKDANDFNANDSTAAFDLFGASTARFHIPHFLTDVLPILYASELIWPTTTHSSMKSNCVSPSHSTCDRQSIPSSMYSALFIEDRVLRMTVSSWVPQLTAMLPGRPFLYSPETLFPTTDNAIIPEKRCFRSVVSFSRRSHMLHSSEWFGEGNGMFDRHGLTRYSVLRPPSRYSKGKHACRVHIVIINRFGWERRHGVFLGRDLVNVDEIKTRIERDSVMTQSPAVAPTVVVEYFENKTFAEQVDIMQRADVIVGVHGAGLSNILFARKDAPILEVLPFTYYAGPFATVAESLYLKYSYMIAEPDTKTFLECIEMRAKKSGDTGISRRAKELWVEALRRRKLDGEMEFLKTHLMTDPSGSHMKVCARTQRLKVDAAEMSRRVLQMAQKVCGGAVEL